jgi:predicted  nucleic acid-binding Zn-ribbon protein
MSNLQGVTDLIARLLAPCQSEHTYDADKEEAAKALKAYEKEVAVWSENYAALERKAAELTRERDEARTWRRLPRQSFKPFEHAGRV